MSVFGPVDPPCQFTGCREPGTKDREIVINVGNGDLLPMTTHLCPEHDAVLVGDSVAHLSLRSER